VMYDAAGCVAASEISQIGRWSPEPLDTRQCRSSPKQGGLVRCCRMRDGAGMHVLPLVLT
jgi:hypothetical protein